MDGESLREVEPRRLTEVVASFSAVAVLLIGEWMLYGAQRASDDAADIVTLCGFAGLAAAALRTSLPRAGGGLASTALGFITFLGFVHGAREGAKLGPIASLADVGKWDLPTAILPAMLTGLLLGVLAWAVQIQLDVQLVPGKALRNAFITVVIMGIPGAMAVAWASTVIRIIGQPGVRRFSGVVFVAFALIFIELVVAIMATRLLLHRVDTKRVLAVIEDWKRNRDSKFLEAREIARRLLRAPDVPPDAMEAKIEGTARRIVIPAIKHLRRVGLVEATPNGEMVLAPPTQRV